MAKNENVYWPIDEETNIKPVEIVDEVKQSMLQYSMSVLVGRAIPDVRDGLKPVHRRILYTMYDKGLTLTRHTENVPTRWVRFLVVTTPTATPVFMTLWCVWLRISLYDILWWTVTETSVILTVIPLLHTVIPRLK